MPNPTDFFIHQQLRQIESRITSAIQRVPHAKTLAELNSHRMISVPSYLRMQVRSLSRLRDVLTKRSEEIVDAQLKNLAGIQPQPGQSLDEYAAALRSEYGNLRMRHWSCLQGHEPRVLQQATRSAEQIIHKLIQAAKGQDSE